jgi:osmotically-inducible protein OsmY
MKKVGVIAATAVLVGVSAAAFAASEVKVYGGPADEQITAAVQAKIAEFPDLLAPNEIRVQTLHKVVYLYGQVNTTVQRDLAESTASQVEGVQRVVDSIALSDGGA